MTRQSIQTSRLMRCSRTCLLLLSLSLLLSGCMSGKFTKTQSEDLAPFAKETIRLVSEVDYSLSREQPVYLRHISYSMESENAFARYDELEARVLEMLENIVEYSVYVVAISERSVTDQEKAAELADYIETLAGPVAQFKDPEFQLSMEEYEQVVSDIRASEDYLGALRKSVPLIQAYHIYADELLGLLQDEIVILEQEVLERNEAYYARTLDVEKELHLSRDAYYLAIALLMKYSEEKDPEQLVKIKEIGIIQIEDLIKNKRKLTGKEIVSIYRLLVSDLELINKNSDLVAADINDYYRSVEELETLPARYQDGINILRLTFFSWSRAYERMASGKSDPAEWFDISDSVPLLVGAAKKAAGL